MREATIDDIRQSQLRMMEYFDSFCKNNGLEYSLAGGTLLGAIRHKGYIPWDDDVDIMMPRESFDKLHERIKEFNNNNIKLYSPFDYGKTMKSFPYFFSKVCDLNTILIEKPNTKSIEYHVYLDIYPIDGLPEDGHKRERFYKKLRRVDMLYVILSLSAYAKDFSHRRLVWKMINLVSKVIKPKHIARRLDALAKEYKYKESKYIGNVSCGQGTKETNKREDFEFIKADFEGRSFSIIKGYDAYLKGLYGDYMQLPPVEKRTLTHDYRAYIK